MARKNQRQINKYFILIAISFIIAVFVHWFPNAFTDLTNFFSSFNDSDRITVADGELSVHYIDVGQGDAELIIAPDGEIMLIDTGTSDSKEFLVEYLKKYNISTIKYLVLTHPHADHIGGASLVLDEFVIKNVIMPYAVSTTSTYEKTLEKIDAEGCKVIFTEPKSRYELGIAKFTVLGPVENYSNDLNNQSAVIRLDYGETSFLFTGDAEAKSEADMLDFYNKSEFKADVLKLGHHGSSTSTSEDWLLAVSPKYAVISCGKDNEYLHPHREILSLLKENGVIKLRTDELGSIVFTSSGKEVELKTSSST